MRTILVAPAAFKGTLSPISVAQAIELGVRDAIEEPVDVVLLPIADGGDGTIEAVHRAVGGETREEQVLGPTGKPVLSQWLKLGRTGLVELAGCCGLATLPSGRLAPMKAHTYGLGQSIARCHEAGCADISIAVGGSASTDGGAGALRALGAVFFDQSGGEVEQLGGGSLASIMDCDLTGLRWLTRDSRLRILTDVDNPLLGARGAAAVFAPQKGASPGQVAELEAGLAHFADVLESAAGSSMRDVSGAGAAGGTAFGLGCALGAQLVSGFDWLAEIAHIEDRIAEADLVVTGEGCFDSQSTSGKATGKLIDLCKKQKKKVLVISAQPFLELQPASDGAFTVVTPRHGENGLCGIKEIFDTVRESVSHFFHG